MQLIIKIDGETYRSKSDSQKKESYCDRIKEMVNELSYFKITLENGDFLLLGKEQLKRAVFIFKD